MFSDSRSKPAVTYALCLLAITLCFAPTRAQSEDENDPVKLFEKGQDAHAKNDLKRAIEMYDAAIKLKPDFPEAEFQRAMALLTTDRTQAAVEGFNRAVALRPDWIAAYAKFGSQLSSTASNDVEAERILRRALELNDQDMSALVSLAVLRERHRDRTEALKLIRAATALRDATPDTWRRRAYMESDSGDLKSAVASISHAIEMDPDSILDRIARAHFFIENNDRQGAVADLDAIKLDPNTRVGIVAEVAELYARVGKPEQSLRVLDGLGDTDRKLPEVILLRAEIAGDSGSSVEERSALEDMLKRNPRDASLLARLGNSYRRIDPVKSQAYYALALQADPKNSKYATGYAAALIQSRKFAEAEPILRRVIAATPDDYTAHANIALALYEMKRFAEAIAEYEWLVAAKPEIAATYFFLATAHDNLGEYIPALDAYGKFLSHVDPANNKLEIDKVNLRLPVLRAQIKRGEGAKPKRP